MTKFNLPKGPQLLIWYVVAAITMIYIYQSFVKFPSTVISYSEFVRLVNANTVKKVSIGKDIIKGAYVSRGMLTRFSTVRVNDKQLISLLLKHGVEINGTISSDLLKNLIFGWILPFGVLFFIWYLFSKRIKSSSSSIFGFGKGKYRVYTNKRPDTTFADVAGEQEAKEETEEIIEFLSQPERFKRLGGRMPKGVLLVGTPGTGKTLLARAVAGEAGVPFISISGSEFVEMFVGVGASRVRDLFETAKKMSPCIIFIDEIDTIGKSRGISSITGGNDEREQTLNQLLAEMDGFDSSKGVIILAATNRPEVLDPALLRPGRFDRQILVDKPDLQGREEIFRLHLKKIKVDDDIDPKKLAQQTIGLVGADIANIVNEGALLASRKDSETVSMKYLEEAIERQQVGVEKRSRRINPNEREIIAYHETGHAIVAEMVKHSEPVQKISIIPRGIAALGYTSQRLLEDRYLWRKGELMDKIAMLFGGRTAEEIIFGDSSTGAQNDLARATDMARSLVARFGMDDTIGAVILEDQQRSMMDNPYSYRADISEETKHVMEESIKKILESAHNSARSILEANRSKLEEVAKILIKQETISGDRLREILEKGSEQGREIDS